MNYVNFHGRREGGLLPPLEVLSSNFYRIQDEQIEEISEKWRILAITNDIFCVASQADDRFLVINLQIVENYLNFGNVLEFWWKFGKFEDLSTNKWCFCQNIRHWIRVESKFRVSSSVDCHLICSCISKANIHIHFKLWTTSDVFQDFRCRSPKIVIPYFNPWVDIMKPKSHR